MEAAPRSPHTTPPTNSTATPTTQNDSSTPKPIAEHESFGGRGIYGGVVDQFETADTIGHVGSPFGCSSVPEIIRSPIDKDSPRARNFAHAAKFEEKYELGYDSDGEAGPWCDMVEEDGPQLFDEEALNSYFSSSLLL